MSSSDPRSPEAKSPPPPPQASAASAAEAATGARLSADVERMIAYLERRTGTRGAAYAEKFALERMGGEHDYGYRDDEGGEA